MNKIILTKELISVAKILVQTRTAFEFPTKSELDKYLREHPDADKSLHWVKRKKMMDKFRWDKNPDMGRNFDLRLNETELITKPKVHIPEDAHTCSKEKLQGYLDKIEDKLTYYGNMMRDHRGSLKRSPDIKRKFDALLDRFKLQHYKLTRIQKDREEKES